MTRPLEGVRILDLTRLLPGGVLTALLGDLGAEVIKVEEPTLGDYMRWGEPKTGDESAASWIVGRNKRSVAIDLKDPLGREAFLRMVDGADVVVEGFRPGVTQRLGIDAETLIARRPSLVYASLTGYGSDGPLRDIAGHDINYTSYAGVLGMTGPPGGPVCPPGVQVGDLGGATILGIGLLAALFDAARTGRGRFIEVAMYDAALAWTSIHAGEYWASGHVPDPGEMLLSGMYPSYNVYACSDGRFLAVGSVEPKFWEQVCGVLGRPDLVERIADPSARADVAAIIATRTRDEWAAAFSQVDACVTPVLDLGEALAHPLASARGMIRDSVANDGTPAKTLGTPIRVDGEQMPTGSTPSRLGEDTVQVLAEAGLSADEIDALLSAGVARHTGTR